MQLKIDKKHLKIGRRQPVEKGIFFLKGGNMNLADNLKKIRKEHNLSQEQLAEKLGVSRQSVSKWESNLAYPEMDKVLQLCKMFNLNIDELLNQDIKEVNDNKQTKNNVNKFIDDFLDYITKTIDMFSSMRFIQKVKCIFEQIIISCIIAIILLIVGSCIMTVLQDILRIIPDSIYYMVYQVILDIYILICLILGISLLLHIFKVRYLDYYIIEKDNSNDLINNNLEENKIILEKPKKERIIIRDPKHASYKFINGLFKVLLFMLKMFAFIIAMFFSFSLVVLVFCLIISFLFIKTGLSFIGILLIIISLIIINLIILNILNNFVLSHKSKKRLLSFLFIISLFISGIGIGLFTISLKDFKYNDSLENKHYFESEKIITMKDNTYIPYARDDQYVESDIEDIKMVYTHSKYYDLTLYEYNNGYIMLYFSQNDNATIDLIKAFINDINCKELVDYDNFDFKIYASKENIIKLKENRDKHLYKRYND